MKKLLIVLAVCLVSLPVLWRGYQNSHADLSQADKSDNTTIIKNKTYEPPRLSTQSSSVQPEIMADDLQTPTTVSPEKNASLKPVFDPFWARFDAGEYLTEDEMKAYFTDISTLVDQSDLAKKELIAIYRSDPAARDIIEEILAGYTNSGPEILVGEAKHIFDSGTNDPQLLDRAFRAYYGFGSEDIDLNAVSIAINHTNGYMNQHQATIPALYFLGKASHVDANTPQEIRADIARNVKSIANNTQDHTVQTVAVQSLLYSFITSTERAKVSLEFVEKFPENTSLFIDTLYGIDGDYIDLDDQLKVSLQEGVERHALTGEELALYDRVINGIGLTPRQESEQRLGDKATDNEQNSG